ncbi:MAG: helix-turn-helix transcriptional regulator [Pseudomonadota bacterium]
MALNEGSLAITSDLLRTLALRHAAVPEEVKVLPSGATLGRGSLQITTLREGVTVMMAALRGVRAATARPGTSVGFHVEARLSGRSSSQEMSGRGRRLSLSDGDLCVAGLAAPYPWDVTVPAQASFEAVSITWPTAFVEGLRAIDPALEGAMRAMIDGEEMRICTLSDALAAQFRAFFALDPSSPATAVMRESLALSILASLRPLILAEGSAQPECAGQTLLKDLMDLVIDSAPPQIWSAAEMAEALGLSASTLQKRFRAEEGRSIGAFLSEKRLSAAREMLRGSRPISDIAAAAGYRTPEAFSKAFSRRFNESPRQYRSGILLHQQ